MCISSTCSDHAARLPPPCTRSLMRSPLLLCIPESDFRAGIKHDQLLLFPESDRSDLHRVVDGKFRESSIIDKRLIFIILRIFFVFVMIVTVNFTLFKINVLVCNRQVRLDLAMIARAIMRLVLSCSMFLRPCFCSPDRSVRSLVGCLNLHRPNRD